MYFMILRRISKYLLDVMVKGHLAQDSLGGVKIKGTK